ncbi:MAG: class I SAM-dependent methyltransferase [Candidatus Levyibacteriota bacterium]
MKKKLVNAWEERARKFEDKKEAVMQQSFPPVLNEYIHKVHKDEILRGLPKVKCVCLDIGCGYGRMAIEVVNKNKEAFVYGIDISETFVSLFNEKLGKRGKGIVADVRKIPFKNNTFDYIYCIVSLMYLSTKKDQYLGIYEVLRVLKPGGKAIIIEPNTTGDNIIKLFGILPFILRKILVKKKVETYGISFEWNLIDKLVRKSGGVLVKKKGYPFFTMFFLPLFTIAKIFPKFANMTLNVVHKMDEKIPFSRTSNIVVYIIEKPAD